MAVVGIQHWQVVIEQVKHRRLRAEQATGYPELEGQFHATVAATVEEASVVP